ncbi:ABC-2 family transporter protein [mine drainage metagenome]|uniref:ABC-2 family transporter protein n=1 Tax=mine drainage metagenome TaxID=410659 RepID=A0A1J5SXG6_9ZZZZ
MIRTIAKKELHSLVSAPSTWWMLALMQFLFAWFYFGRIDDYLQVQAQLAQLDNAPGATISVVSPLCSVLALMLMMLIPLFTMRLIAEERRNRTWVLLLTAPVSAFHIVLGKFIGLMLLIVFIVACCVAMLSTLMLGTHADIGLMLANILGVLLLAASYAALGLYFSALNRQPVIAAAGALGVSFGLWLLDLTASDSRGLLRAISPNSHFQNLNTGMVNSADLIYFVLFIATLLWLTIRQLNNERRRAS